MHIFKTLYFLYMVFQEYKRKNKITLFITNFFFEPIEVKCCNEEFIFKLHSPIEHNVNKYSLLTL